jgi:hypothetical protein
MPQETTNSIFTYLSSGTAVLAGFFFIVKNYFTKLQKESADQKKAHLANSVADSRQDIQLDCHAAQITALTKRLERLESIHMSK